MTSSADPLPFHLSCFRNSQLGAGALGGHLKSSGQSGDFSGRDRRSLFSSFPFKSGFQPEGGALPQVQDTLSVLPSNFAHSHTHKRALWVDFCGFSSGGSCYQLPQTATKSRMSLREQETRLRRSEGPIQDVAASKKGSFTSLLQTPSTH